MPIRVSVPVLLAAALAAAATPSASAQFTWVDGSGRVTYSDLPPPPDVDAVRLGKALPPPRSELDELPAALRQAAQSHPVVLYTTSDCGACQQARAFLSQRGIPFEERTVRTGADADAFRRVGFTENAFPGLTVGRERAVGFEADAWGTLLDAAGYPSRSLLPRGFKPAPPRALAAPAAPAPGTPAAGDATATARPNPESSRRAEARIRTVDPRAESGVAARDPNALRF